VSQRVICQSCDWIGPVSDLLVANNPFDQHSEVYGCPKCYAIDDTVIACDEPGCDREATNGWPSEAGYRQTCFKHSDMAQQRQQAQGEQHG
jgi:hypothetical protein